MAATAILATITTASFSLVHTANSLWRRHRDDSDQRRQAVVALQHIMRRTRQATRVMSISPASDASGTLTLLSADESQLAWKLDSGTGSVLYGLTAADDVLAEGIQEMTFVGLKADGATPTTEVHLIHAVTCTIEYAMDRPSGPIVESLSCTAWLRSW